MNTEFISWGTNIYIELFIVLSKLSFYEKYVMTSEMCYITLEKSFRNVNYRYCGNKS